MKPFAISAMMVVANLVVIILAMQYYAIPADGVFVAIVAAVLAGAIIQRVRFGQGGDPKARFDPMVTAGSIVAFNAVLVIVFMVRS